MIPSNDDVVARLVAEREIHRTFYRFFRLVDTKQYEQLVEVFTEDAHIEYHVMPGPAQIFAGRDEFAGFMSAGPRDNRSMVAHVIGQTVIDWRDGKPSLEAYATVWHWFGSTAENGHHRPADWTVVGLVQDDFEHVGDEWLISRRHVAPVAGLVAAGTGPFSPLTHVLRR